MAFRYMRFDRPTRSERSTVDDLGVGVWRTGLSIAALVAMVIGVAYWFVASARKDYAGSRDEKTLCLVHGSTPQAELTLLDQTDRLAAGAGQHFSRLLARARDTLPRNGRLTLVSFGGDLGRPLEVQFDICSPGRAAEADAFSDGADRLQRDYEAKFAAPLRKAEKVLAASTESDRSPIAAQIMRAANDPTIGWRGQKRVLNVFTDGLENTDISKVYADGVVRLPPPPANLLRGVTVNYFELASAKHSTLQTAQVRAAWRAWFEAAGAEVNMYAPGYAAVI